MSVTLNNMKNTGESLYIGPKIPQGLTIAIEGLTKEIIRHRPEDIYIFAANHFEKLIEIRKQYHKPDNIQLQNVTLRNADEIDNQLRNILCVCKGNSQPQEIDGLKASGWSLNETANVLKRHRSIFGDFGKKLSLDEIYDLANTKHIEKLTSNNPVSKHHLQDSKSYKKTNGDHCTCESKCNDTSKDKINKSEKNKKALSQRKIVSSQKTHYTQTKEMQSDKIESILSSTKISNVHGTDYSNQTRIEELQSSSYIQKVYQTVHETTSVMEEKVEELKQYSDRMPKCETSDMKEANDNSHVTSNISSKLSKSTTCLTDLCANKSTSHVFENKLQETQNLLEKISTNFNNQTIKRSMSAKDLCRTNNFGDFTEPKLTEINAASKLRKISLPTVRPLSASRNDLIRKYSLNETNNCLTLPLISQKANKNPKQTEKVLTLPILSPSNSSSLTIVKTNSKESDQFKAETKSKTFATSGDADKQNVNVSEKSSDYSKPLNAEGKSVVYTLENKKTEVKSSRNDVNKDVSTDNIKETKLLRSSQTCDTVSSKNDDYLTSTLNNNQMAEKKDPKIMDIKFESEVNKRTEVNSMHKNGKEPSENLKPALDNKLQDPKSNTNKPDNFINENTKVDNKITIEIPEEQINKAIQSTSEEPVDQNNFQHQCSTHHCTKSLNNELLRSKLEELVRAEKSILQDDTDVKLQKENNSTDTNQPSETNLEEPVPHQNDEHHSTNRNFEAQALSSAKKKQQMDDETSKCLTTADSVYSYILSEGSPCEIPNTVTTIIFPDPSSRMSNDIQINTEEINNDLLTTALGEPIVYDEIDYNPFMNVDLFNNTNNILHDISIVRQDLHRIKEEEEEEEEEGMGEENDVCANEDSTIVLKEILESEEEEGILFEKKERESDLSLQEFLLHCTMNASTEDTSINENGEEAVIPYVPELNLQIIEDATESTSKTGYQKCENEASVDEIENSLLPSERTSNSNYELEGLTHECLSGEQQLTTGANSGTLLEVKQVESSKSSSPSLSGKLIHAVTTIQKYYRQYKSKKQKVLDKKEMKETIIFNNKHNQQKNEIKSSDEFFTKSPRMEIIMAVMKIQRCYRQYKSKKSNNNVYKQTITSRSEISISSGSEHKKLNKEQMSTHSNLKETIHAASIIQKYYRKYKSRKRNNVSSNPSSKQEDVEQKKIVVKFNKSDIENNENVTFSCKSENKSVTAENKTEPNKVNDLKLIASPKEKEDSNIDLHEIQQCTNNTISKENEFKLQKESVSLKGINECEGKTLKEKELESVAENDKSKTTSTVSIANKQFHDEQFKHLLSEQMLVSIIKIQRYYRNYTFKKLNKNMCNDKEQSPSTSTCLQHTGEFHDCIPLTVLAAVPKTLEDEKSEETPIFGISGNHKKTRREWNRNPSSSPNILYKDEFLGNIYADEDTFTENKDTFHNERFPGVMIYADSLKNNFKQSIPEQNIMKCILFSGEQSTLQKSCINFVTMQNAQSSVTRSSTTKNDIGEQLRNNPNNHRGVYIEEISCDDD